MRWFCCCSQISSARGMLFLFQRTASHIERERVCGSISVRLIDYLRTRTAVLATQLYLNGLVHWLSAAVYIERRVRWQIKVGRKRTASWGCTRTLTIPRPGSMAFGLILTCVTASAFPIYVRLIWNLFLCLNFVVRLSRQAHRLLPQKFTVVQALWKQPQYSPCVRA